MLLSRNYAPSPALAPYVRRLYVFEADLPADFVLTDRLLSETAFIRILLRGDWRGDDGSGDWRNVGPMPFFGANGRPFGVRVTGGFKVIGIAIRCSGWWGLFDWPAAEFADRMLALESLWGETAERLHADVAAAPDDAAVTAAVEHHLLARVAELGARNPDPAMARFEDIARHDSTMRVADAAQHLGLSVRKMERDACATFGHTPKTVLRRSRFLDMATALRGFSTPSDEEYAALRYFDQSHRNREFRRFIGMTPGHFEKTPTPLLTAGLKLRADGIT